METVPTANGDYLVSFITHLTIVSNVFMKNGIYPLMFLGTAYNINRGCKVHYQRIERKKEKLWITQKKYSYLFYHFCSYIYIYILREREREMNKNYKTNRNISW